MVAGKCSDHPSSVVSQLTAIKELDLLHTQGPIKPTRSNYNTIAPIPGEGFSLNIGELKELSAAPTWDLGRRWKELAKAPDGNFKGHPSTIYILDKLGYGIQEYSRLVCTTEVAIEDFLDGAFALPVLGPVQHRDLDGLGPFVSALGGAGSFISFKLAVGSESLIALLGASLTGVGLGFIAGIGLSMLYDAWDDYNTRPEMLKEFVGEANGTSMMSGEEYIKFLEESDQLNYTPVPEGFYGE